jgi:polysaccharide biosynthesis transport protein
MQPKPPITLVPGPTRGDKQSFPLLLQYLRVATRWRYVILGIVGSFLVIGLVTTLLMTPKYTAVTTVEISRESSRVTEFQGVDRDTGTADQEFYQTQYGLLRSRTLAERVALQLRLTEDPAFFARAGVSSANAALQLVNGRYSAARAEARERLASDILLKDLDVSPSRLSRLVAIQFTSSDPAFSARVANAWADNFIKTNLARKVQATSYGRNLLQEQLAQIKERLDASQRQLVAYASNEQIINLPSQAAGDGKTTSERSIVADDLAALNASLSQATADRIQAEARYQQAGRKGSSAEALGNQAINSLRQRRAELAAEYQRMMIQFEPGYPAARAIQSQIEQLDRSIGSEEGRVSGALQASYNEARQRESALQSKVNQLKSNYLDLRRRSIQYNIYQQEVDTNRVLYDGLLQRFKEIGVAGGVGVNNISVVDLADVPEKPSSPRLLVNLAIALLLGLGLGALAAFSLEQMDDALADPSEVERRLGLPLLGSVPKLGDETPMEAIMNRKSDLIDAYLAVQTSLAFTTEHGVPRSFAVTSTRPAEGKSSTALALATTLTRAQRKVILVDGDMRSPSIHSLCGINHDRGLSNYLSGDDDIQALTMKFPKLGFSVMTAGPIPPNAAELLAGSRLSLLVERLLESYDHIVIDSPPVMGIADAPLIASRVEGVIYAIESNSIRSSLVKTALARLDAANVRVFGGVLTKFQAHKSQYGYEYGYSYGRGDEKPQRG